MRTITEERHETDDKADAQLDARGLACPLPVLKAKKAIRGVPIGSRLTVLATDPTAVEDFANFCAVTGHELLASDRQGDAFRFVMRRTR